ncbi:hypothetical protein KIPB_003801 [Kipferlia bialata]|uniref:Uncharacterized protein n=1 Tax=Kipferlia bialata TaxID=797122 RepID=A0A9K3GGY8_9EUKA|nr:hypothetical protein KIPB_003801 [Kipferlia bialata]|eukprot:g3801.t1
MTPCLAAMFSLLSPRLWPMDTESGCDDIVCLPVLKGTCLSVAGVALVALLCALWYRRHCHKKNTRTWYAARIAWRCGAFLWVYVWVSFKLYFYFVNSSVDFLQQHQHHIPRGQVRACLLDVFGAVGPIVTMQLLKEKQQIRVHFLMVIVLAVLHLVATAMYHIRIGKVVVSPRVPVARDTRPLGWFRNMCRFCLSKCSAFLYAVGYRLYSWWWVSPLLRWCVELVIVGTVGGGFIYLNIQSDAIVVDKRKNDVELDMFDFAVQMASITLECLTFALLAGISVIEVHIQDYVVGLYNHSEITPTDGNKPQRLDGKTPFVNTPTTATDGHTHTSQQAAATPEALGNTVTGYQSRSTHRWSHWRSQHDDAQIGECTFRPQTNEQGVRNLVRHILDDE